MLPVLLEESVAEIPAELSFLNFIPKSHILQSSEDLLDSNEPAAFKSKAERLLMEGKEEVFEMLYDWFQKDEDILDEILMLHTRWNTLKKKLRIRLITVAESKIEENKIIHASLSIIGKV